MIWDLDVMEAEAQVSIGVYDAYQQGQVKREDRRRWIAVQ